MRDLVNEKLRVRLNEVMAAQAEVVAPLISQQERIAALVALCEEVVEELAMFAAIVSDRYDVGAYRERLAALKGAG